MFNSPKVSASNITTRFDSLASIGNLGTGIAGGFLRAAWSAEETAAINYIKQIGSSQGLIARSDPIGNLYLRTPGKSKETVQVGSHLDTVPRGGLYDGGVGVVCGLEAIISLKDHWPRLKRELELVVWRGEESATFNVGCKGSQAAFGILDPLSLKRQFQGSTLEAAITSQSFDPEYITKGRPTLSPVEIDGIAASIEVHIEQARKLEIDQKDIGIVTSIRGSVRFRVEVFGESAHSGGTPPGKTYRKDANLAIAYMQVHLDEAEKQFLLEGQDIVHTVGVINCDRDFNFIHPSIYENAQTKISHYGYFLLDIRSDSIATLERFSKVAQDTIKMIADEYGVRVEVEKIGSLMPLESLDKGLQASVRSACVDLGYSFIALPSGGYHDVAIVAQQKRRDGSNIPCALIFIPCLKGISHNPAEYSSPEAIAKGANVVAALLLDQAR